MFIASYKLCKAVVPCNKPQNENLEVKDVPINLGSGRFASVYRYANVLRGMPVVARRFSDFTVERQIYSAVNKYHVCHKNILRCRG